MQLLQAKTISYQKRMPRVKSLLLFALFLICTLNACSSGASPAAQTRPTITPPSVISGRAPTPLPRGTVLYQGDWSHDLKSWRPSSGWKLVDGMLQSMTTGDLSITLPYRPTVNDYALHLRLRVFSLIAPLGNYLIAVDPVSGHDGYRAGVIQFPRPDKETNSIHPELEIFTEPINLENPGTVHDLGIHYEWHDYRLEIHGATLAFYLDDQITGRATSQAGSFANGPIRLELSSIGVQVSEFRVVVP